MEQSAAVHMCSIQFISNSCVFFLLSKIQVAYICAAILNDWNGMELLYIDQICHKSRPRLPVSICCQTAWLAMQHRLVMSNPICRTGLPEYNNYGSIYPSQEGNMSLWLTLYWDNLVHVHGLMHLTNKKMYTIRQLFECTLYVSIMSVHKPCLL